jgi:hypothetical protein
VIEMNVVLHLRRGWRLLVLAAAGLLLLGSTAATSLAQSTVTPGPGCSAPTPVELDSIARSLADDLLQASDIADDPAETYRQSDLGATPNEVLAFRLAAQMPEFSTDREAGLAHAQALLVETCRQIGAVTGYSGQVDHVDSQLIQFGSAQGAADYLSFVTTSMVAPADPGPADAWNEVAVVTLGDETRAFTAVSPDGPLGRPGPTYLTTLMFRRGDTLGVVQLVSMSDNPDRASIDRTQRLAHLVADRLAASTRAAAAGSQK